MDTQQIKQLAADIINKKKTILEIPRGATYYTIQNILLKMGNLPLVKAMGILSGQRLAAKGYQRCGIIGWVKAKDISTMGIDIKNGNWVVTNPEKFSNWTI